MKCSLIWLFIVTVSFAVSYAREVYYKLGSGQRYGPCQEEEVLEWSRQGHFENEAISISTADEPDIYIPSNEYFQQYKQFKLNKINTIKSKAKSSPILTSPKKLLRHFRKTLGPLTKTRILQQANHNDLLQPRIEDDNNANIAPEFNNNMVHEEISTVSVPKYEVEPEQFLELEDDNYNSNIDQSIDDDMLLEVKRNSYNDNNYDQQLSDRQLYSEYHDNEHKEPIIEKISIKSLASDTERLWAEDKPSPTRTIASYNNDEDVLQSRLDSKYSISSSITSIAHYITKAIVILLFELCRLFCIVFGSFIPAVVRHSFATLITLLSSGEGRVVVLGLLLRLALSTLRGYLFLALIPNILPILEHTGSTTRSDSGSGVLNVFIDSATKKSHASDIIIEVLNSAGDLGNPIPTTTVSIPAFIKSITRMDIVSISHILEKLKFSNILYALQSLITSLRDVNISAQCVVILLALLSIVQIVILPIIDTELIRESGYISRTETQNIMKSSENLLNIYNNEVTLRSIEIISVTTTTVTRLMFWLAVTQLFYQHSTRYASQIEGAVKGITSSVWVPLGVAVSLGVWELYTQPSPNLASLSPSSEEIVCKSESFLPPPEVNQQ